jgi:CPW-WPC domain-containing protein
VCLFSFQPQLSSRGLCRSIVAAAFAPLASRAQASSFLAFQGKVSPGAKAAEALAAVLSFRKDANFLQGVPLLAGLAETVGKSHPDQPMSAVQYDLMEALQSSAKNEGLPAHDLLCTRDYSACCPEGWVEVGDGANCLAPIEYTGNCPARMSYAGLTPLEKSMQALGCNAFFPCMGSCTKDYEQLCPDGWAAEAGGACTAPDSYAGRCVRRQVFGSFNELQKASWATSCGVSWPCRAGHHGASLSQAMPRELRNKGA